MKNKIIFIIMLLIIIILSIALFCSYNKIKNIETASLLDIKANPKFHPNTYTDDEIQGLTHILVYSNEETDKLNKALMLYTFDEFDKCVSLRLYYDFKSIEDAKNELENKSNLSRPEINNNIITFSSLYENTTKDEVISNLSSKFNYIIF